ncbi:MAG: ATP-binding cassette domain-containing protein [Syntrophaceticus sp.]
MAACLEIEDLYFQYHDGTKALKGVSLSIQKEEKVAILGPNGAGKSTLLLHLNGIHLPQQGIVRVNGVELNSDNEHQIRSMIGLVFQDPDDQVFSPTVWDDVAFGPLNMGLERAEIEKRVADALHAVRMWEFRGKAPHHLSYGQKKRVAIAGVLAMDPEIIVLDEPTAFLDPAGQEDIFAILEDLHREGRTIILATHDVDMAAMWATSILILKDGQILAQGTTELLVKEDLVESAGLRLPLISQVFQDAAAGLGQPLPRTVVEGKRLLFKLTGH